NRKIKKYNTKKIHITNIKDNNIFYTITIKKSKHDNYQIYEKGHDIQNKEIAEFIENIKQNVKPEDYIIFSGSLPSGMDSNFYMVIICLLHNKNNKCILYIFVDYINIWHISQSLLVIIYYKEYYYFI